ncbi:MAG: cytochrome C, partial [Sulfuriferula sp.]
MERLFLVKNSGLNRLINIVLVLILSLITVKAQAVPAFARQTGQNCVACHAGGQFPELTPYGRLFKLTGYTLG